jgi:hypothetical protein
MKSIHARGIRPMVNVNDDVKQMLREGLEEYCEDKEICFRLMQPAGEEIWLMLDTMKDDDVVIKDGDEILLLIEQDVAENLDGSELCIRETKVGPRLAVSEPLATSGR